MAGIYLHIPYCRHACHYCDFHFSTSLSSMSGMVACMLQEIEQQAHWFNGTSFTPSTLYLGGGTPSLLPAEDLERLMSCVRQQFSDARFSETTLEANPEDVDALRAASWKSLGINRISLGVQSFQDSFLQQSNRKHSGKQAEKALDVLHDHGFTHISADLIFGFFGQTTAQLEEDIQQLLRCKPSHISVYCMTVEQGTVFGKWTREKKLPEQDELLLEEQFYLIRALLQDAGYPGYEVSNFAPPGSEALHNSSYWTGEPYLGIGPSAHSLKGNLRRWNLSSNADYIRFMGKESYFETEELNEKAIFNERMLTGLRTLRGFQLRALPDFMSDAEKQRWEREKEKLIGEGLVEVHSNTLALTQKGLWRADGTAMRLFV